MVEGFESFRNWFKGYGDQYTIIGGTACDLLMTEEALDFRATRDIDLVLIVEALTDEFGKHFWEYIHTAGYQHRKKSNGAPQFYRFDSPKNSEYPLTITHAFGETILEAKPERIATISWGKQDVPLALGIVPVGISDG